MTKGVFSSDRFQEDLKKYKAAIEQISDENKKNASQKLLNDLILNIKRMDNMYLDMVYSNQLGSIGGEMREKIIATRKKLDNLLKE